MPSASWRRTLIIVSSLPAGSGPTVTTECPLPRSAPGPTVTRPRSAIWPATSLPAGSYEPRPQLAVLATAHDDPADWLRAGQALQRVLLTGTAAGLAASFLYQPIELHDMRQSTGWWPWPECPQIILRLGYGPAGAGSPRRRVDDILS